MNASSNPLLKYILSCEWKSVSNSFPFLIETGGKIDTENGRPMRSPIATQLISTIFLNTRYRTISQSVLNATRCNVRFQKYQLSMFGMNHKT